MTSNITTAFGGNQVVDRSTEFNPQQNYTFVLFLQTTFQNFKHVRPATYTFVANEIKSFCCEGLSLKNNISYLYIFKLSNPHSTLLNLLTILTLTEAYILGKNRKGTICHIKILIFYIKH